MRGVSAALAIIAGLGWAVWASGSASAADELNVIVTIKPVHSLAAAVMDGAGSPKLLIKGAGSPHSYALRPSDARNLSTADLVVRVSENLESFLAKPIETLSKHAKVVTLADIPDIKLLPMREGGAFEPHDDEGEHHGAVKPAGEHDGTKGKGAADEHHGYDPHLWLTPANAAVIADYLADVFGKARPGQAALFKANAEKLKARLHLLDAELSQALAPLKGKPFIVFHDAYHYFEDHYGLKAAGSITIGPERQPGAARLKAIRAKIQETKSVCVFSEPQFEPKLISTLIEGTDARKGVLDPLGADLAAGKDQYFKLMRHLASSLNGCLAGPA